jgi:hypothetical protein
MSFNSSENYCDSRKANSKIECTFRYKEQSMCKLLIKKYLVVEKAVVDINIEYPKYLCLFLDSDVPIILHLEPNSRSASVVCLYSFHFHLSLQLCLRFLIFIQKINQSKNLL